MYRAPQRIRKILQFLLNFVFGSHKKIYTEYSQILNDEDLLIILYIEYNNFTYKYTHYGNFYFFFKEVMKQHILFKKTYKKINVA